MQFLQIETRGEVSFPIRMETTAGYRYDIPFDNLSLPSLPLSEALRERVSLPEGTCIGRGHPAGFPGLIGFARQMLETVPNSERFIRAYYTRDRFDRQGGYSIRSLKPGNVFEARIAFPPEVGEEAQNAARKALESISRIGFTGCGVSGEVTVRLVDREVRPAEIPLSEKCRYHALHYTVMLLSPACFYEPYRGGSSTSPYVPGAAVRQALSVSGLTCPPTLRCANAYLSDGQKRLLPMPLCASRVKLDKTELRYRMAAGKNPNRVEQLVSMENTFTGDQERYLVRCMIPEMERIVPASGKPVDALQSGQLFSGILYGSDGEIRAAANHLTHHPILHLGDFRNEGFGEAVCRIDRVCEEDIPAPILTERFDLCCASDVMLISDTGMPACGAEDLLAEAERVLGTPRKLRLLSKFTGIRPDFSRSPEGGWDRNAGRCLQMGSVLRVETVDGRPVDISPLLHSLIGERTEEGYGELIAYPAREDYYRAAENQAPAAYALNPLRTPRDLTIGARFVSTVMRSILRAGVERFAALDREEYKRGVHSEALVPMDLLRELRDRLDPAVTEEKLREWYLKALQGEDEAEGSEGSAEPEGTDESNPEEPAAAAASAES